MTVMLNCVEINFSTLLQILSSFFLKNTTGQQKDLLLRHIFLSLVVGIVLGHHVNL